MAIVAVGALLWTDELWAADRLVPSEYATIQAAIEAASAGDHVVVDPGVYAEAIDLLDRAIVVRSTGGPAITVIDSTGIAGSTVSAVGIPSGITLEGFTIRGGSSDFGGGLFVFAAPLQLRNCVVTDCHADSGSGAFFAANQTILIDRCRFEGLSSPGTAAIRTGALTTIIDSAFIENVSEEEIDAGVIRVLNTGSLHMERCIIADNATANSPAVMIGGAPTLFVNCVFKRNSGRLGGAICKVGGEVAHFMECIFYRNTAAQGGAVNLNNGGASAIFEDCTFLEKWDPLESTCRHASLSIL